MKRFLVTATLAVLLGGCGEKGETGQQVLDRFRPRMDAMRETLRGIHGRLPAAGTTLTAKLDPPPQYDKVNNTGNTEFIAAEHLLDESVKPVFDLVLSRDLKMVMNWSGPNSVLSKKSLQDHNPRFAGIFERALANRYLIVLRSHANDLSVSGRSFRGGGGSVEAFVYDMTSGALVAATNVSAEPDAEVDFQYREGENEENAVRSWVHSNTWTKLRTKLAGNLTAATGGTFVFGN